LGLCPTSGSGSSPGSGSGYRSSYGSRYGHGTGSVSGYGSSTGSSTGSGSGGLASRANATVAARRVAVAIAARTLAFALPSSRIALVGAARVGGTSLTLAAAVAGCGRNFRKRLAGHGRRTAGVTTDRSRANQLTCSCAAALPGIAAGRAGSTGRVIARGTTCRDVAARARLGRDHATLTGAATRGVAANALGANVADAIGIRLAALSVRQLVTTPIGGLKARLVEAICVTRASGEARGAPAVALKRSTIRGRRGGTVPGPVAVGGRR